jgi:two-component sensor histidine kinase
MCPDHWALAPRIRLHQAEREKRLCRPNQLLWLGWNSAGTVCTDCGFRRKVPLNKPSAYSVRSLLIIFGLAVAIPLVVLLAILLYRSASAERAELERRLLQVASNLAELIDRDIDRSIALLQTLATSPAVTSEDWPRFYDQAKAALTGRAYLVLVDATGRQIINTYVPYGEEPTLTGDPATLKRILVSKGPVVSDLFVSLVVKSPVYNISIPVLRDDAVRYVMSLGLLPEDLARTLESLKLNQSWVTTIWDRDNVVLARSRDNDRFLGTKLPNTLRQQQRMPEAVLKATNLDGERVLLAVTTSKLSDWGIAVSVPVAIAEAPLRSTLWLWSLASLTTLAIATLLGLLIGRLLVSSLVNLAKTAQTSGETIPAVLSKVQEVNAVGHILQQTRERQNLLLREVSHRVKNMLSVVQALVTQSLGTDPTLAEPRQLVIERLHALARAQDALVKGDWSSVPLADIVASELAAFGERVTISGPPVSIKQDMVQSLTLVLHELLTNAVKYGSLSAPGGRVAVSWRTENSHEPSFLFEWREFGGPKVSPPSKRGLGTLLLEKAVPGAATDLFYESAGFVYRLCVSQATVAGE